MAIIKAITTIRKSGIANEVSSEIFDTMAQFAGYGFNKSHAAAYAAISFQTGFLKTNFPECYFAAAMNVEIREIEEISSFASELKKRNIELLIPDINRSEENFRPVRSKTATRGLAISYALAAIRGVGRQVARDITEERDKAGPFTSVRNFSERLGSKINRKASSALAHAGAFDEISPNRATAALELDGQRSAGASINQLSMFDLIPEIDAQNTVDEYALDEKLDLEFDVLGHYHSDHPLARDKRAHGREYYHSAAIFDMSKTLPRLVKTPVIISDTDIRQTKKGELMAVIKVSDKDRAFEVLAFADKWPEIRHLMKKKSRVLLNLIVMDDGDERRLMIESADVFAETRAQRKLIAA